MVLLVGLAQYRRHGIAGGHRLQLVIRRHNACFHVFIGDGCIDTDRVLLLLKVSACCRFNGGPDGQQHVVNTIRFGSVLLQLGSGVVSRITVQTHASAGRQLPALRYAVRYRYRTKLAGGRRIFIQ